MPTHSLFLKDAEGTLLMFSANHDRVVKLISDFTKKRTEENFLDYEDRKKESELDKKIREYLKGKGLGLEIVKVDRGIMGKVVKELKFKQGIDGSAVQLIK